MPRKPPVALGRSGLVRDDAGQEVTAQPPAVRRVTLYDRCDDLGRPGHVGAASGFNSAVARIAGLIATALLGFVFAQQGSADGTVALPGSMGAKSFIVRGKGNPESFHSCSHGAGRAMSRKRCACNVLGRSRPGGRRHRSGKRTKADRRAMRDRNIFNLG
jgi:tRNA-splicing ligase RtcB